MKIRHTEVSIVLGDITGLTCEAIVNPAYSALTMNAGLSKVIKTKGGAAIEQEAVEQGPVAAGEAVATGAGALPCKKIIHAVTVETNLDTNEDTIRTACANALALANELGVKSIALPALGTGAGGFAKAGAAKIMAQEVLKAIVHKKSSFQEVIFCLMDEPIYNVFQKAAIGYLEHVVNDLSWGPYVTVDVIIEMDDGIVVIERSTPPYGWALPGGFVEPGESLEHAIRREAKEETNLDLEELQQMHTYSDPSRDQRFHTISTVFTAKGAGTPQAGDDAKNLRIVSFENLCKLTLAFDHARIIEDFLKRKRGL